MEHDANFTPWVLAAQDAGAKVQYVEIHREDCTLDLDDLRAKLNDRTRLVAIGCASNATGTRNPVAEICQWARQVGALTFLDAVHLAPHDRIDVTSWGCDFLVCSAYKFFGPHVGVLWGRRELLETLAAYKLRPAPNQLPGKWMTGTQNHACLVGTLAAIDYLASLGRQTSRRSDASRTQSLSSAYESIVAYEKQLVWQLIEGLRSLPGVRILGITDAARHAERLPTVAWTHNRLRAVELAEQLGEQGFFVWHGNYYALPLTEALGLEPDGMVRVGLTHYNTAEEVRAFVEAVAERIGG
jgi:cysteine desulfurase family protein (TIGR01976 family)